MVDERGLSDTSPGNDRDDIYIRVCPGIVQKSYVLLRPNRSLPVTGNLAIEMFSGLFPADALRGAE